MGDQLFPFPEPTFLFIHDVFVGARGAVVTNLDGSWRHSPITETKVRGYVTAADPKEVTSAASRDVVVDAVLLVSNRVAVRSHDRVRCDDPAAPPILTGVFSVEAVRPNASHTRVLLRRVDGEPTPVGG